MISAAGKAKSEVQETKPMGSLILIDISRALVPASASGCAARRASPRIATRLHSPEMRGRKNSRLYTGVRGEGRGLGPTSRLVERISDSKPKPPGSAGAWAGGGLMRHEVEGTLSLRALPALRALSRKLSSKLSS